MNQANKLSSFSSSIGKFAFEMAFLSTKRWCKEPTEANTIVGDAVKNKNEKKKEFLSFFHIFLLKKDFRFFYVSILLFSM